METQTVEQSMKELENRVYLLMEELSAADREDLANRVQDIWDETNFLRDEHPEFNFGKWREATENTSEDKIMDKETIELTNFVNSLRDDLVAAKERLAKLGFIGDGWRLLIAWEDAHILRNKHPDFNFNAWREQTKQTDIDDEYGRLEETMMQALDKLTEADNDWSIQDAWDKMNFLRDEYPDFIYSNFLYS